MARGLALVDCLTAIQTDSWRPRGVGRPFNKKRRCSPAFGALIAVLPRMVRLAQVRSHEPVH
jgi:hypothetical protein